MKIGDCGQIKEEFANIVDVNGQTLKSNHIESDFYISPELENNCLLTKKVDIYAMGIILFELLYPFSTMTEKNDVNKIIHDFIFIFYYYFLDS